MEAGDISDLKQMGTTGSSDKVALNSALPDIIARVKEYATVPLTVGFGVSTREHYNTVVDAGAEGVVVGSRLVSVIKQAPPAQVAAKVEEYCRSISLKGQSLQDSQTKGTRQATKPVRNADHAEPLAPSSTSEMTVLPPRFGQFGGQYVPEALFDCLIELEQAHKSAMADPEFWKEWEGLFKYMNRPSNLYFAEKLTEHAGGAKIWMKREDLFVHHSDYLSSGLRAALAITQARIKSIML
jgi:tryptophan synthase